MIQMDFPRASGRPVGAKVVYGVPEGRRWPDEDLARLLFDERGANPPPGCSSLPFAKQPEAIRAVFLAQAARLNQRWWGDATSPAPAPSPPE